MVTILLKRRYSKIYVDLVNINILAIRNFWFSPLNNTVLTLANAVYNIRSVFNNIDRSIEILCHRVSTSTSIRISRFVCFCNNIMVYRFRIIFTQQRLFFSHEDSNLCFFINNKSCETKQKLCRKRWNFPYLLAVPYL